MNQRTYSLNTLQTFAIFNFFEKLTSRILTQPVGPRTPTWKNVKKVICLLFWCLCAIVSHQALLRRHFSLWTPNNWRWRVTCLKPCKSEIELSDIKLEILF